MYQHLPRISLKEYDITYFYTIDCIIRKMNNRQERLYSHHKIVLWLWNITKWHLDLDRKGITIIYNGFHMMLIFHKL
jgi:hypothetical protein